MSILMLSHKRASDTIGSVDRSCPSRSKSTLPFPSTKPRTTTWARLPA